VASRRPDASQSDSPGTARPRAARDKFIRCLSRYEREARERGFRSIAGVDEVGRGALFGPVFAAAVVLHPDLGVRGLKDSKVLDREARTSLAGEIKRKCVAWALGAADAFEIDQINIYQASRLAMKRAVEGLSVRPDFLLVDAMKIDVTIHQEPLIDGDARCRAIAAASIVAKVARDECMDRWQSIFPQYNLTSNKGYSTPDHKRALRKQGPTFLHRFSFEPVRLSCPEIRWTGYEEDATQQELFAEVATGDQE
jgi:ribonuclease HII